MLAERAPAISQATEASLPLTVDESAEKIVVRGRDFCASFDRKLGAMDSYVWRGVELLAAAVEPDFWRAPTNNDRGAKLERKLRVWRDAGKKYVVDGLNVAAEENGEPRKVVVEILAHLPTVGDAPYNTRYTVDAAGVIDVAIDYTPKRTSAAPMLPRFGTLWTLDGSLNQVTWYGRGPWPTYSDRKQAPFGIYAGSVADQFVHFFRPQENSNKVDVRWVAVTNPSGSGLLAIGAPSLSVGVSEFDKDQMERSLYDFQMENRNRTYLNLDLVQMGLGGIDSWGQTAMRPYLVPNHDYSYHFMVRGIDQPPAVPESN